MTVKALLDGRKLDLTLRMLSDEDGAKPLVLIEGTPDALKFLGKVFVAMAKDKKMDGLTLAPDGAGSRYFNPKSDFGLYIHVPEYCGEKDDVVAALHAATKKPVSKKRKKP